MLTFSRLAHDTVPECPPLSNSIAMKARDGWRNIPISNNVGGVKCFSSVLIRAL